MDRFTKSMGAEDQDVMNLRAGIDGLVFNGWTDAEIAAGVVEMAQMQRKALNDTLSSMKGE